MLKKLSSSLRRGRKQKFLDQLPSAITNEAINFQAECIFIAIPKTGTSTVRSQLRQNRLALIPNPHLSILQARELLYVHLLRAALGQNDGFPSESVPSDVDLRTTADNLFQRFFKFSGVRNPWARAVSPYFRREGVQVRDKMSFEQFCDFHQHASDTCRQPTLHSNQLDWLCDASGKCLMDYVYRVESFDQAIREIADCTDGRIRLANAEANVNPLSRSESYRSMYTEKSRRLIAKRFEKDIDCFKYVF